MSTIVSGSCLCGQVAYEMAPPFRTFQYCHCSRCRKVSGSAHSASILIKPEQLKWTRGEEAVGWFAPEQAKHFATAFCRHCGSSLPALTKSQMAVIVPAGSLDDDPPLRPTQNIFCDSDAAWYVEASQLPRYDQLPPKTS